MHETDSCNLELIGELMYESHASYSQIGLGSPETDLLIELIRRRQRHGKSSGLFGAKITGGGSGGTVAVLASADTSANHPAVEELKQILTEYKEDTGVTAHLFSGSSNGLTRYPAFQL
jgi:L-arabinokinase